jgi:hypothetical protein
MLEDPGQGHAGKTIPMSDEDILAVYLDRHFLFTDDARVFLEVPSHQEFVIAFEEINLFPVLNELLQALDHTPVPGIDIPVVTMVKIEKITEDHDHIRVLAAVR